MPAEDVKIEGGALETWGFTDLEYISAFGVLTFGFLWGCADIYLSCGTSITTNWSNAEDSITTTWTVPTGGIFGDC